MRKELYESCIQKAESTKKPLAELKPEVSDQTLDSKLDSKHDSGGWVANK